MGWSWAGAAEWIKENEEKQERIEEWERSRKERMTQTFLPEIRKRQNELRAAASIRAGAYKKGVNLFGEKVANALENMGSLEEVVGQYKGTEADIGWAKGIVARTGGMLNDMLSSEDVEQQKLAKDLLIRGSQFSESSAGVQADALAEIMADGYVTQEEYLDLDLGSIPESAYSGRTPDLGRFETLTPTQLEKTATDFVFQSLGDQTSFVTQPDGTLRLTSPTIDGPTLRNIVTDTMRVMKGGQESGGVMGGRDSATEAFSNILTRYPKVKIPSLNPTETLPDLETPADAQRISMAPATVTLPEVPTTTPMTYQERVEEAERNRRF